jgi:Transposase DDE domain group 1
LIEAPVVFTEGTHLPLAGLLLILPALAATGLVEAFAATYGRLRNAFYGLRPTLLMLLFLALLRDPRAEGATRIRPADLGWLRNLPCKGYDQNRVWLELSLAAADLLTWAQALCFDGALARCEPAAFRYRVGHVAARLVRTGRSWRLRLDRDWPWAAQLATAFNRLRAAPWPA